METRDGWDGMGGDLDVRETPLPVTVQVKLSLQAARRLERHAEPAPLLGRGAERAL